MADHEFTADEFQAALANIEHAAIGAVFDNVIMPNPAELAYRVRNVQADLDAHLRKQAETEWQAKRQARLAAQQRRQRRRQLPTWRGLYRPLKARPLRP